MYYSNGKQKESEEFPKIMSKEDTKELSSIINLLNSSSANNEKIGLNLQYRQVKLPQNIYNSLKERKLKAQNYLENETKNENNVKVISLYEENKSTEEQYIRSKIFEIENLERKIKKLKLEEAKLNQESENARNSLINSNAELENVKEEKNRIQNYINNNKTEGKKLEEKIAEIQEINIKKMKKKENLKSLERYRNERNRAKEDDYQIKKLLCVKCNEHPRDYFYTKCQHLALCKNCYIKANNSECPICKQKSELVMKVLIKRDNNDYAF